MKYKVEYVSKALKSFEKLDHFTKRVIVSWIGKNLEGCENPIIYGKPLNGNLKGLWSYRIGDYRIIAKIIDGKLVILLISFGHRRDVYKEN